MSKKIIIAEDSSVIQNLVKKILQQINYDVTTVKNGRQVLDLVEREAYDLVLMDINMPVMNGMECSQEIRKIDKDWKNIPIIAVTGNAANHTPEQFKEAGINAYLPKPIDYDLMVETVKEQLNDH